MASLAPTARMGIIHASHVPLEELLEQRTHQWKGYVTDKYDLLAWKHDFLVLGCVDIDQSAEDDYDYPMTPEDERPLVRLLYDAMCDFSDPFEERGGKKSFQVERLKKVSDIAMEMMAWEILSSVQDLYQGYNEAVPSFNGTVKYQSFGSFGARLRAVISACREHKSIVYNLFAQTPIQKLVANPQAVMGIKTTNAKINGGRAEEKRRGQEALQKMGTAAGHGVIGGRITKK